MTTAEILEIKQLARQFAEAELRPHVEKWDHDARLDPQALAQLAELGFFGMLIPEAYGGMEFDLPTYVSVMEELAWGEPGVALTVAMHSFVTHVIVSAGSDEQKRRWLEPMARGEVLGCVAITEENKPAKLSGSKLSGEKEWVTNGDVAQLALVVAGSEAYLIPTDTPGYRAGERETTMGFRPLGIVSVALDNVAVEADQRLSGDFDFASETHNVSRLAIAAISIGIAQAALDHAVGYADIREQFSTKLREFEGIQFKLAEMATRAEAARGLLQRAAAEPSIKTSSMAKFFGSETAMWVTTNAVQVYGGYGYMRDYPVEKLMRDAKAMEILEGTNEIQRVLIARELYR
jgi:alkylation response protein AidB-like acyl-CoA dehydrogenase